MLRLCIFPEIPDHIMKTNRREFIQKSAAAAALGTMMDWASAETKSDQHGALLPTRQLTRDGTRVTALSLGGYHLGAAEDAKTAEKLIERSMELGIRFYDNARGYHDGRAEEYMGKFLTPKYRENIFLMTKSQAKDAKGVKKHLDASLKALNTDYVDLWQIHAIDRPEDVDRRLDNGVLDAFLEAKEAGKAKYIGFTGHRNPTTHLHLLKKLEARGVELDASQMPLNVCDPSFQSFEQHVLPVLIEKGYGVIAMKTMAGGSMMGKLIDTTPKNVREKGIPDVIDTTELTAANLHQYVYSLPISSLCSGCREVHELEANVKVLNDLKSLSEDDKARLIAVAKPYAGLVVENYKMVL